MKYKKGDILRATNDLYAHTRQQNKYIGIVYRVSEKEGCEFYGIIGIMDRWMDFDSTTGMYWISPTIGDSWELLYPTIPEINAFKDYVEESLSLGFNTDACQRSLQMLDEHLKNPPVRPDDTTRREEIKQLMETFLSTEPIKKDAPAEFIHKDEPAKAFIVRFENTYVRSFDMDKREVSYTTDKEYALLFLPVAWKRFDAIFVTEGMVREYLDVIDFKTLTILAEMYKSIAKEEKKFRVGVNGTVNSIYIAETGYIHIYVGKDKSKNEILTSIRIPKGMDQWARELPLGAKIVVTGISQPLSLRPIEKAKIITVDGVDFDEIKKEYTEEVSVQ